MKKAELIQALETKFHRVETPVEQADYGGLKYYLVKVYDLVNDGLRDVNIAFYVEDEGQPSEAAYWSPSEPKPSPVSGFQQELATFIASKILAGAIKGAFAEKVDQVNETAIYQVVWSDLSERRYFVSKDVSGDLQLEQLA